MPNNYPHESRKLRFLALTTAFCAISGITFPASAATELELTPANNAAVINKNEVVNRIVLKKGSSPVRIDINDSVMRLLGGAGKAPMIVNSMGQSMSANISVNSGDLYFGTGTAMPGGVLEGQITLNNGKLTVVGDGDSIYYLNKAKGASGSILATPDYKSDLEIIKKGKLIIGGDAGASSQPLTNIVVEKSSLLQANGGMYADTLVQDASQIRTQDDISANNVTISNASSLSTKNGNITLGDVVSSATNEQAYNWNTIEADTGNVHIAGSVNVKQGLANIIAGKDITFADPEIIANHGNGALFLKAGGNMLVEGSAGAGFNAGDANLSALTMRIAGTLTAGNVDVSELSASEINLGNDATIHGGSTVIGANPVSYGSFTLTGSGESRIGGNLDLFNVKTNFRNLDVGGSAAINGVKGAFDVLKVNDSLVFNGGALAGSSLSAKNIKLGGGLYATSLNLDTLGFDSLMAGRGTTLTVNSLDTSGGALEAHGAAITSGNAGSAQNPLGSISLYDSASFTSKRGVWTRNLVLTDAELKAESGDIVATGNEISVSDATLAAPNLALGNTRAAGKFNNAKLQAQDTVTLAGNLVFSGPGAIHAGHNVVAEGSLSDNGAHTLEIVAGGDIRGASVIEAGDVIAQGVSAASLSAKNLLAHNLNISGNLAVTGGSMVLDGATASSVGGNLSLKGSGERSAHTSSFGELVVGGALTVADSELVGDSLKTEALNIGGSRATTVSLGKLDDNARINIGSNAFVTLGATDSIWLKDSVSGLNADLGAAGIYEPIVLGQNGGFNMTGASSSTARASGEGLSFSSGSFLLVPGEKAYEGASPSGMISASAPKTAQVANGARLQINGVAHNKVYVVLGNNITTRYEGNTAWEGANLSTDSHVLRLEKIADRDGSFIAKATRPYPGLDSGIGDIIGGEAPGVPSTPITPVPPSSVPSTPITPVPPSSVPSTPITPVPPSSVPSTPITPVPPSSVPSTPITPVPPSSVPSTPITPVPPSSVPSTPITPVPPSSVPSVPIQPSTPVLPSSPVNPDNSGTTTNPGNPGGNTPGNTGTTTEPNTPGGNTPGNSGATPEPDGSPNIPTAPETPPTPEIEGPTLEIGTEERHLNSQWGGIRFLSRVTSTRYMDHDYDQAVKTLESSARMVILGAVPQMAASANAAASDGAAMRTSFSEAGASGILEESYGLNGRKVALWIMPMFRNVSGQDLTANNFSYDLYGGLGGVALGGDWTCLTGKDLLRLGLDFNIGGGYAQSGGDLAKTTNNMGFWGAGIYAAWLHDRFGLAADAQFTATWNSLKQDLPSRLEMADLEGDVTASAISAGLRAEYKIPLRAWELVPHAGFRYVYLTTDNYTFYSDSAVMDGEASHQNIWTFPIGATLTGFYETEGGWRIKPRLDLSIIPAAGDMNARTNIQFTGIRRNATVETQIMDYFTGQASLGMEFSKNNFSLGVSYSVQAGMKTVSQSVFGSLRYEF